MVNIVQELRKVYVFFIGVPVVDIGYRNPVGNQVFGKLSVKFPVSLGPGSAMDIDYKSGFGERSAGR